MTIEVCSEAASSVEDGRCYGAEVIPVGLAQVTVK